MKEKKKLTKFQKVMKWIGIAELALFIAFLIYLFGFRIAFVKINDDNPEQYTLKYHGELYIKEFDSAWLLGTDKFAGFAGSQRWIFKSVDESADKFIYVKNLFDGIYPERGLYHRSDIELSSPSSQNISRVYYDYNSDVSREIKKEIIRVLDEYNDKVIMGKPILEAKNEAEIIEEKTRIICNNSEYYSVYCEIVLYLIDESYYILIKGGENEFIPISKEIGQMMVLRY